MSAPLLDRPVPAPRRLRPYIILSAVMLLVGALGASTVLMLAGDGGDQHRFTVRVFLAQDATGSQKAAIESALHGLHPLDGITFETREQAWQKFTKEFKDRPALTSDVSADALPESFGLTTTGTSFDCVPLAAVKRMPGVEEIQVLQLPTEGHPGAVVGC